MKENNNNTIYKYSQLYDILLEKILATNGRLMIKCLLSEN